MSIKVPFLILFSSHSSDDSKHPDVSLKVLDRIVGELGDHEGSLVEIRVPTVLIRKFWTPGFDLSDFGFFPPKKVKEPLQNGI